MLKQSRHNQKDQRFFATCPKGLEQMLQDELVSLGAISPRVTTAGVSFCGRWELAYRVLIWSRLASRLLHPLSEFTVHSADDLRRHVRRIDWTRHMDSNGTLSVDANVSGPGITHSHFAAQTVKDGVVDQFRARFGHRPNVDRVHPDIRLNLRIKNGQAVLSLDLSGTSLHQRGYRQTGGPAPLKENLAAALLIRAGWPEIAARGGSFVDPCCGSATLLIEAALIQSNTAPGLLRSHFGIFGWKEFDRSLWEHVLHEAEKKESHLLQPGQKLLGFDHDSRTVATARAHVQLAGVDEIVSVSRRSLHDLPQSSTTKINPGLLLCNPPYGERLGALPSVVYLHARLGVVLSDVFPDWKAAIFAGRPSLVKATSLKADKSYRFFNGTLPCLLLIFKAAKRQSMYRTSQASLSLPGWGTRPIGSGAHELQLLLTEKKSQMTNQSQESNQASQDLYASELPGYPATLHLKASGLLLTAAQPGSAAEEARLNDILLVAPIVLDVDPQKVEINWTDDPAFTWNAG